MATITVPKKKYEQLERKAALYNRLLERAEKRFPIELYSDERMKQFLKEDAVSPRARRTIGKLLASRSR